MPAGWFTQISALKFLVAVLALGAGLAVLSYHANSTSSVLAMGSTKTAVGGEMTDEQREAARLLYRSVARVSLRDTAYNQ